MTSGRPKIVAVDGPAGSGKSSICGRVAKAMGWTYINTGAIYRAVGVVAKRLGLPVNDEKQLCELIKSFEQDLQWEGASQRLFYRDQDITQALYSVESGNLASAIAKLSRVREALLPLQRHMALTADRGVLVDGRDIGTVVFPDADLKIFMTASLEERAKRRLGQIKGATGEIPSDEEALRQVMDDIASRDKQDSGRDSAPMKMADDAVVLDTSSCDLPQAVESMINLIRGRGLIHSN